MYGHTFINAYTGGLSLFDTSELPFNNAIKHITIEGTLPSARRSWQRTMARRFSTW